MMMFAHFPIAGMYRVEVSGWDQHQAFFVEKSDLEWNEDSGKLVMLCNAVSDGALVFLRLLQSLSADRSHPVPYQAELLATTAEGHRQFRLHTIGPRMMDRSWIN